MQKDLGLDSYATVVSSTGPYYVPYSPPEFSPRMPSSCSPGEYRYLLEKVKKLEQDNEDLQGKQERSRTTYRILLETFDEEKVMSNKLQSELFTLINRYGELQYIYRQLQVGFDQLKEVCDGLGKENVQLLEVEASRSTSTSFFSYSLYPLGSGIGGVTMRRGLVKP